MSYQLVGEQCVSTGDTYGVFSCEDILLLSKKFESFILLCDTAVHVHKNQALTVDLDLDVQYFSMLSLP